MPVQSCDFIRASNWRALYVARATQTLYTFVQTPSLHMRERGWARDYTICSDLGLICGVYVVPDTALYWVKKAMTKVIDQHKSAGIKVHQSLYMDCACCNGKAGLSVDLE